MVSATQTPVLRWIVAPRPDHALVLGLADRLSLPEALAALLVQRGHHEAEAARHYLRPALGALTELVAEFDLELLYNIAPLESDL